ncbi:glycosyltransferase 87 family protein [Actinophytocola sp.]|uniref:glycosyltransferase 87 family protein n=1 Tax=Actinophytocola sp. TaxID=1872138 RepID=UPI002ED685A2
MRRWLFLAVLGVTSVLVVIELINPKLFGDVVVYRSGGAAWMHGIPLYTREFPSLLPFTYPPMAAVLFSVLAMVPKVAAIAVLSVAGLVALSATTVLATRTWLAGVLAVACALAIDPVRSTLMFGQVNLVLMGLVAADCLLPRTRYPRGMLIGIAAAVKLTPAFFVLFFLVRRQYTPAVTAGATFAAVTGTGMLLAPADSVMYWHTTVFATDRIGGAAFATNQSLRGALTRLDLSPSSVQITWLVLGVAVLALAWRGARRTDPVVALLVVAAAGLLVSPVSWSHHWVWVVPALAVWMVRTGKRAWPLAMAAVFGVGQFFMPNSDDRELAWTWWQHVVGNSYLLAAGAFLVWSCVARTERPEDALEDADRPEDALDDADRPTGALQDAERPMAG